MLPAGGRLLVWLDGSANHSNGATHLDVKLSREAGDLALARPDGSFIDRLSYGLQETDFSASRSRRSDLAFQWLVTPGASNGTGAGQPMGLDVGISPPEAVPAAVTSASRSSLRRRAAAPRSPCRRTRRGAAGRSDVRRRTSAPTWSMRADLRPGRPAPEGPELVPARSTPSRRWINVDEYNEDAKFFGLKDLTLNNMDNDFSMMHERLAYFMARQLGIPASRANHARITVNGQFYGLYTNVETVKKQMVARWFADNTGSLFEGTDVDFVAGYIPSFELESGADDRSKLTALATALTLAAPDEALAAASAHVDLRSSAGTGRWPR